MNASIKCVASAIVVAMIAACGSPASPGPGTPSPSAESAAASIRPPSPSEAAPSPSATTSAEPSTPSVAASAAIPIRASARELSAQEPRLAVGRDGSLYVSISVREGPAVLLRLDKGGRPSPGWPVAIKDSTRCGVPFPVDDGTVRIVCDDWDRPGANADTQGVSAIAFDANGQLMPGWPVKLAAPSATGMGTDLTMVTERRAEDSDGVTISHVVVITHIGADGTVRDGTPVPLKTNRYGDPWVVGPDGVAFTVAEIDEDTEASEINAIDSTGPRPGWPVTMQGVGSAPSDGSTGKVVVTLGSAKRHTTRISTFGSDGTAALSPLLPLASADRTGETGGCTVMFPRSPIVAKTGPVFVYSEMDASIYGLDPGLAIMKGWPYEPSSALAVPRPGLETEHEAGYCPTPVVPAAAPDGTLVLSLEARDPEVGGSLVAVGANGRVRAGWPVELKRAGAEFWAIAVGPDGTAYALAVEPEVGGKSSESILAIAPDSTVRYTTTIVDP